MPVKRESRILLVLCPENSRNNYCSYCVMVVLRGTLFLEEMLLCNKDELLSCFSTMRSLGEALYTDSTSFSVLEEILGNNIDKVLRQLDLRVFPESKGPDLSDWYGFLHKLRVQVYKLCKMLEHTGLLSKNAGEDRP